jgi:hypothetical protein
MKIRNLLAALTIVSALFTSGFSTPSTEFWTAGTADIQPFGIVHVGVDNYFTIFRKAADGAGGFPTDLGITVGVLPFSKVQLEIGVDLMEPTDFPLLFNAKLGTPEGSFGSWSPSLAVGIFNVGTEKDVTTMNVMDVAIGKTIPVIGRLFIGGYLGDKTVIGGETNKGITLAWDRYFIPAKGASGTDYNKLMLCADWASGKNYYGAGGAGIAYFFNENVSILTGPAIFNDESLNGKWKWSIQFDANLKAW